MWRRKPAPVAPTLSPTAQASRRDHAPRVRSSLETRLDNRALSEARATNAVVETNDLEIFIRKERLRRPAKNTCKATLRRFTREPTRLDGALGDPGVTARGEIAAVQ
ncbi:hypothetical protein AA23498_0447 [Acetobacter nitrogenifigens DSM 23921 = NBRC 105050]|uniref:Uncharacterized protein n=2 Tax=Acetobacter nitrogenifigens TaxID=285268 RepID=A0A511XBZ1_9PROT|nr:hypothetical protein AA23498_0447 [Acetobacter nitrogenifigens DSM 23921 = NBRC 105050]GEN60476.1 hypothetical protein ANI02nite_23600 [Acetobacter nitrogenifigens DSM 23921 = NBRC 105050]